MTVPTTTQRLGARRWAHSECWQTVDAAAGFRLCATLVAVAECRLSIAVGLSAPAAAAGTTIPPPELGGASWVVEPRLQQHEEAHAPSSHISGLQRTGPTTKEGAMRFSARAAVPLSEVHGSTLRAADDGDESPVRGAGPGAEEQRPAHVFLIHATELHSGTPYNMRVTFDVHVPRRVDTGAAHLRHVTCTFAAVTMKPPCLVRCVYKASTAVELAVTRPWCTDEDFEDAPPEELDGWGEAVSPPRHSLPPNLDKSAAAPPEATRDALVALGTIEQAAEAHTAAIAAARRLSFQRPSVHSAATAAATAPQRLVSQQSPRDALAAGRLVPLRSPAWTAELEIFDARTDKHCGRVRAPLGERCIVFGDLRPATRYAVRCRAVFEQFAPPPPPPSGVVRKRSEDDGEDLGPHVYGPWGPFALFETRAPLVGRVAVTGPCVAQIRATTGASCSWPVCSRFQRASELLDTLAEPAPHVIAVVVPANAAVSDEDDDADPAAPPSVSTPQTPRAVLPPAISPTALTPRGAPTLSASGTLRSDALPLSPKAAGGRGFFAATPKAGSGRGSGKGSAATTPRQQSRLEPRALTVLDDEDPEEATARRRRPVECTVDPDGHAVLVSTLAPSTPHRATFTAQQEFSRGHIVTEVFAAVDFETPPLALKGEDEEEPRGDEEAERVATIPTRGVHPSLLTATGGDFAIGRDAALQHRGRRALVLVRASRAPRGVLKRPQALSTRHNLPGAAWVADAIAARPKVCARGGALAAREWDGGEGWVHTEVLVVAVAGRFSLSRLPDDTRHWLVVAPCTVPPPARGDPFVAGGGLWGAFEPHATFVTQRIARPMVHALRAEELWLRLAPGTVEAERAELRRLAGDPSASAEYGAVRQELGIAATAPATAVPPDHAWQALQDRIRCAITGLDGSGNRTVTVRRQPPHQIHGPPRDESPERTRRRTAAEAAGAGDGMLDPRAACYVLTLPQNGRYRIAASLALPPGGHFGPAAAPLELTLCDSNVVHVAAAGDRYEGLGVEFEGGAGRRTSLPPGEVSPQRAVEHRNPSDRRAAVAAVAQTGIVGSVQLSNIDTSLQNSIMLTARELALGRVSFKKMPPAAYRCHVRLCLPGRPAAPTEAATEATTEATARLLGALHDPHPFDHSERWRQPGARGVGCVFPRVVAVPLTATDRSATMTAVGVHRHDADPDGDTTGIVEATRKGDVAGLAAEPYLSLKRTLPRAPVAVDGLWRPERWKEWAPLRAIHDARGTRPAGSEGFLDVLRPGPVRSHVGSLQFKLTPADAAAAAGDDDVLPGVVLTLPLIGPAALREGRTKYEVEAQELEPGTAYLVTCRLLSRVEATRRDGVEGAAAGPWSKAVVLRTAPRLSLSLLRPAERELVVGWRRVWSLTATAAGARRALPGGTWLHVPLTGDAFTELYRTDYDVEVEVTRTFDRARRTFLVECEGGASVEVDRLLPGLRYETKARCVWPDTRATAVAAAGGPQAPPPSATGTAAKGSAAVGPVLTGPWTPTMVMHTLFDLAAYVESLGAHHVAVRVHELGAEDVGPDAESIDDFRDGHDTSLHRLLPPGPDDDEPTVVDPGPVAQREDEAVQGLFWFEELRPDVEYQLSARTRLKGAVQGDWRRLVRFRTRALPTPHIVHIVQDAAVGYWSQPPPGPIVGATPQQQQRLGRPQQPFPAIDVATLEVGVEGKFLDAARRPVGTPMADVIERTTAGRRAQKLAPPKAKAQSLLRSTSTATSKAASARNFGEANTPPPTTESPSFEADLSECPRVFAFSGLLPGQPYQVRLRYGDSKGRVSEPGPVLVVTTLPMVHAIPLSVGEAHCLARAVQQGWAPAASPAASPKLRALGTQTFDDPPGGASSDDGDDAVMAQPFAAPPREVRFELLAVPSVDATYGNASRDRILRYTAATAEQCAARRTQPSFDCALFSPLPPATRVTLTARARYALPTVARESNRPSSLSDPQWAQLCELCSSYASSIWADPVVFTTASPVTSRPVFAGVACAAMELRRPAEEQASFHTASDFTATVDGSTDSRVVSFAKADTCLLVCDGVRAPAECHVTMQCDFRVSDAFAAEVAARRAPELQPTPRLVAAATLLSTAAFAGSQPSVHAVEYPPMRLPPVFPLPARPTALVLYEARDGALTMWWAQCPPGEAAKEPAPWPTLPGGAAVGHRLESQQTEMVAHRTDDLTPALAGIEARLRALRGTYEAAHVVTLGCEGVTTVATPQRVEYRLEAAVVSHDGEPDRFLPVATVQEPYARVSLPRLQVPAAPGAPEAATPANAGGGPPPPVLDDLPPLDSIAFRVCAIATPVVDGPDAGADGRGQLLQAILGQRSESAPAAGRPVPQLAGRLEPQPLESVFSPVMQFRPPLEPAPVQKVAVLVENSERAAAVHFAPDTLEKDADNQRYYGVHVMPDNAWHYGAEAPIVLRNLRPQKKYVARVAAFTTMGRSPMSGAANFRVAIPVVLPGQKKGAKEEEPAPDAPPDEARQRAELEAAMADEARAGRWQWPFPLPMPEHDAVPMPFPTPFHFTDDVAEHHERRAAQAVVANAAPLPGPIVRQLQHRAEVTARPLEDSDDEKASTAVSPKRRESRRRPSLLFSEIMGKKRGSGVVPLGQVIGAAGLRINMPRGSASGNVLGDALATAAARVASTSRTRGGGGAAGTDRGTRGSVAPARPVTEGGAPAARSGRSASSAATPRNREPPSVPKPPATARQPSRRSHAQAPSAQRRVTGATSPAEGSPVNAGGRRVTSPTVKAPGSASTFAPVRPPGEASGSVRTRAAREAALNKFGVPPALPSPLAARGSRQSAAMGTLMKDLKEFKDMKDPKAARAGQAGQRGSRSARRAGSTDISPNSTVTDLAAAAAAAAGDGVPLVPPALREAASAIAPPLSSPLASPTAGGRQGSELWAPSTAVPAALPPIDRRPSAGASPVDPIARELAAQGRPPSSARRDSSATDSGTPTAAGGRPGSAKRTPWVPSGPAPRNRVSIEEALRTVEQGHTPRGSIAL